MLDDLGLNVTSALSDINSLSNSSNIYAQSDIGKKVDLKVDGLYSIQSLNFLFSPTIDKTIDLLLDVCINGKFDVALGKLSQFIGMFDSMGIGQGLFNGQIGSHVIQVIKDSVNSMKFAKTKNKIKKVLLVIKNLQRQIKKYKDPEMRKKYEEAVYAIKSVISVIAQLYKHRKSINDNVLRGLGNIVFESNEDEIIYINKIEL